MYRAIFLLSALCCCVPITQTYDSSSRKLELTDKVYEETIRTVRLYAAHGDPLQETSSPVIPVGQWNLQLEFDDLTSNRDSYYARFIHCNASWEKSGLSDLDFMTDYNEYPINNFEFSVDTHIPYVHYWFRLPPVKLPGNYVIAVYRGSDRDNVILSKRFLVYQQRMTLARDENLVGSVSAGLKNQQINFTVNYKNIEVINPMESINVSIQQNQRWDNLRHGIKPSFIREDRHELEYRFFDDAHMFFGGNEFRFFDLRSLNNPGRNVVRVDRASKPLTAYIEPDGIRSQNVYAQYADINGNYILQNYDYQDNSYSNYVNVRFTLNTGKSIPGDIYVAGQFNQWSYSSENKMEYDSSSRQYQKSIMLKQGYYNYQYVVKSATLPANHIEGNYFEAENQYEIFIYYRAFQPAADLLVGYYQVNENRR